MLCEPSFPVTILQNTNQREQNASTHNDEDQFDWGQALLQSLIATPPENKAEQTRHHIVQNALNVDFCAVEILILEAIRTPTIMAPRMPATSISIEIMPDSEA